MDHTVTRIAIHPESGGPAVELEECVLTDAGLAGDRPRKAAVYLVSADDAAGRRANLVVTLGADELAARLGTVLRVGDVELGLGGTSGSCPGAYAEVVRGGTIRVGDPIG